MVEIVGLMEFAAAIGLDAEYVRVGLLQGIVNFGRAIKIADSSEYSYYCSDKRVWEETGYFRNESQAV